MPKATTKSAPSIGDIDFAIEQLNAERAALEKEIRELRLVAAHKRLRGETNLADLIAARADLAALDDVRAGLTELAVKTELSSIETEIAEQQRIADDADSNLLQLHQDARQAWSTGGYNKFADPTVTRPMPGEEVDAVYTLRINLAQQIAAAETQRAAARRRIADLQKRGNDLAGNLGSER